MHGEFRIGSCALALASKIRGFRLCVRTPEFGKPEGRTADPSAPLRSGRDDNSSWKLYLESLNKIVIPQGAPTPIDNLSTGSLATA
jgi:hypothetical protein